MCVQEKQPLERSEVLGCRTVKPLILTLRDQKTIHWYHFTWKRHWLIMETKQQLVQDLTQTDNHLSSNFFFFFLVTQNSSGNTESSSTQISKPTQDSIKGFHCNAAYDHQMLNDCQCGKYIQANCVIQTQVLTLSISTYLLLGDDDLQRNRNCLKRLETSHQSTNST